MSAPNLTEESIDGPAIVELMGHRQVAGVWRAVQVAGVGMLRVEVPATDGVPASSHLYHPAAVYGIHPCEADTMLVWVARLRHEPFNRLAITAAPPELPVVAWANGDGDGDGEEQDDDGAASARILDPWRRDPDTTCDVVLADATGTRACGLELPCPEHDADIGAASGEAGGV